MDPNEALPDVGIEDLASDPSGEFLENFKYLVGLLIQWIASGKKIKKKNFLTVELSVNPFKPVKILVDVTF